MGVILYKCKNINHILDYIKSEICIYIRLGCLIFQGDNHSTFIMFNIIPYSVLIIYLT